MHKCTARFPSELAGDISLSASGKRARFCFARGDALNAETIESRDSVSSQGSLNCSGCSESYSPASADLSGVPDRREDSTTLSFKKVKAGQRAAQVFAVSLSQAHLKPNGDRMSHALLSARTCL